MSDSYWNKVLLSRISRRRAIAATGALGAGAALLAACGGGGDDNKSSSSSSSSGNAPAPSDPTKGNAGGKLVWQGYGDIGGNTDLVKIFEYATRQFSGFTNEGLYETRSGTPAFPGTDKEVQPLLATALPEISPDKLTYTIKLKNPVSWQDGTPFTSQDVKWSLETYATKAAWVPYYIWLDSVQATDAQTVVMKTKFPFVDSVKHLAVWGWGDMLNQKFQEGPDATKKLMGTGAFTMADYTPGTSAHFKKNPAYHTKPYPYFDEIEWAPRLDYEKGISDVIGKNVNVSYWYPEADRDRIKKGRSDLQAWQYDVGAEAVRVRTDKAPWKDERVRQALSMAIDRKPLIQALTNGEGEADQYLSWAGGFRKPKDLGANAKYYDVNLTEVKALMTAAGITAPIKAKAQHWNATVIGQRFVDQFTQIKAAWKNAGVADITSEEMTHPQLSSGPLIGNYDDMFWFPNIVGIQMQLGLNLLEQLSWGGQPHQAPTFNLGWVDDPALDALLMKQLGQFDKAERSTTFRSIEDYLAQKQYAIVGITHKTTYFGDPRLRNAQMGQEAYNGALPYFKYWWYA